MPTPDIRIAHLADHPETLPLLRSWFETEWAEYYGPSACGDAARDLAAYSGRDRLPIGLVAFYDGRLGGIAALKEQSVGTHPHLTPWAAAGLVTPELRGHGIGARLLVAIEDLAREMGYGAIYCGTATSASLLERGGWEVIDRVRHEGEEVAIYRKGI